LRVVALLGSRSIEVFEHLISNAPQVKIYALIGNGFVPNSLGKINGFLVLSKEDASDIKFDIYSPKEMFPYLGEGDFLLMLGFSRGFFPKVLSGDEGEFADTSFALAQIDKVCLEGIPTVSMDDLWEFLLKRVPEYPALLNCGLCGFKSCKEYLRRAVEGKNVKCLSNHAFLSVNRKIVDMNPFIINQLKVLVKAYLSTLKGIDTEKMKELHIKLEFE